MSIHNLRLRGEIRNLICGDSSSLELRIDPLIWSYDCRHVGMSKKIKDQRSKKRVKCEYTETVYSSRYGVFFLLNWFTEIDCWETFWTNMKQRLVSALY